MTSKPPRQPRRALSSASVITSVVVHGGLALGVVAVGVWGSSPETRERVYALTFAPPALEQVAERAPEEFEPIADEREPLDEPAALPVPVELDPAAFDDVDLEPVPLGELAASSTFVFGPRASALEVEPEEASKESEPEPRPDEPPPEPTTVEPVDAEPDTSEAGVPTDVFERLEGDTPDYPRASVRLGEEGDVVLELGIDAQGYVTAVEVTTGSGHRRLDRSAMTAALTWRFPAGTPGTIRHTVHFRLSR